MISKKMMKRIFPAFLIALLAAGSVAVWAASSEKKDNAGEAANEPAWSSPAEVASSASLPVSSQRIAGGSATLAPTLVGTAVVEGGTSFAIFQSTGGTRLVREGHEVAEGVRLVRVRMNQIDLEQDGVREEVRLGWSRGEIRRQVRPAWVPGAAQGGAEGPWGSHKDKVQYRREMLARHRSQNLK